jgi:hypothetical protein
MSLPSGQRRALNRIKKALTDDDLHFGPLFAIFTRPAAHEAMLVTERVTAQPRRLLRRMRRTGVTVTGLAVVTGAFMLSQTLRPPGVPGHGCRCFRARAVSRDRAAVCLRAPADQAGKGPHSPTRRLRPRSASSPSAAAFLPPVATIRVRADGNSRLARRRRTAAESVEAIQEDDRYFESDTRDSPDDDL